ncbi:MAG: MOSC domain-containing protein [Anaerolineae bacterium]|nr:MOSC domain-containing protein [Anaerolineae bacterium]
MKLLSVNVSKPIEIPYRGETLRTGIYKKPVPGRVMLRAFNLEGDGQADLTAHGGADKAVYAYPFEHYTAWARELKRGDFAFGQFGENFTVAGLLEDQVGIGDVYRIGGAVVEVTQPRAPCYKLAHKMGLPNFVKTFTRSERSGFYLRVLEEGEVEAGDAIERLVAEPEQMSVQAVFHLLFFDKGNVAEAERALRIPALAGAWREIIERMILDQ